jgi:Kae1-associated kinase Bud32
MKMELFSEGAESRIYLVRFMGLDRILKRRIAKNYRINDLDSVIRAKRTKNEAKIIGTVSSLGVNAPNLLFIDKYDLLMSYIAGKNLGHLLKGPDTKGMRKIFGILGNYAAILHNKDIIHGDFTPANVIIGYDNKVYLIDFGLSEISNSIEEKALDLLLMKRAVDKDYFGVFVKNYKKNSKDRAAILKRLDEIERRGRYSIRTLLSN